jgi:hypothetical protein
MFDSALLVFIQRPLPPLNVVVASLRHEGIVAHSLWMVRFGSTFLA